MAQARSDRRERVAAEKEKALQSKGKGKGATKTTTKAKVSPTCMLCRIATVGTRKH